MRCRLIRFLTVVSQVFSNAKVPYADLFGPSNIEAVVQYVLSGHRLECPEFCSKEVYAVLLHCWAAAPDKRPTFTRLREFFHMESVGDLSSIENLLLPLPVSSSSSSQSSSSLNMLYEAKEAGSSSGYRRTSTTSSGFRHSEASESVVDSRGEYFSSMLPHSLNQSTSQSAESGLPPDGYTYPNLLKQSQRSEYSTIAHSGIKSAFFEGNF